MAFSLRHPKTVTCLLSFTDSFTFITEDLPSRSGKNGMWFID